MYFAHPYALPLAGVAVLFTPDDAFYDQPEAWDLPDCAVALMTRAGSWSARNRRNGFVPTSMFARFTSDPDLAVAELLKRNLWRRAGGGCQFTRWPSWTGTAEAAGAATIDAGEAERRARKLAGEARRQALFRNPDLKRAIRERDADRCRYCAAGVRWGKGRSGDSGTYDHIDPDGDNSLENLVVACCSCNSAKRRRTPAEAGMILLDPPAAVPPPGPRNGSRNASNGSSPDRNGDDEEPLSDDQDLDQSSSSRGNGNRHLEAVPARETVTLVTNLAAKKTRRAVSGDEAIRAIAVWDKRAEDAGNVIHDPVKFYGTCVKRERDLEAILAPPPDPLWVKLGATPEPVSGAHPFEPDPSPFVDSCARAGCGLRRMNARHVNQEANTG
jgi:hypothetical protein